MYDIIKKIVTAGLDAQDKVVDFLDDLVTKGKLEEKDREKLLNELDKKFNESKEKGEDLIKEIVDKVSAQNPFVNKKDVTDMENKISELEKKLRKLEGHKKTEKKPAHKKAEDTPKSEESGEA